MVYLNTTDILDNVLAKCQDVNDALRTRLISYLNSTFQLIANERDWQFLEKTVTVTIVNGIIVTPPDFERMTKIVGADFVLSHNDLISENEAAKPNAGVKTVAVTTGLQLIPETTGTVDLTYIQKLPVYSEDEVTLFPTQTRPYIERAVLTEYYEYDADDRWTTSTQQSGQLLAKLKQWDNGLKPLPQYRNSGRK